MLKVPVTFVSRTVLMSSSSEHRQQIVADDAGVVDEQINFARALDNFFRERGAGGGIARVHFFGGNFFAGIGGDDFVRRRRIVAIGENDFHSRRGKDFDDGAADSPAAAGDDGNSAGQTGVIYFRVVHPEMQ